MSRTDKDRPWWVKSLQDGKIIDHDHRKGVCIPETLELNKFYSGGTGYRRHPHCKKSFWVDVTCSRQMINGRKEIVYSRELSSKWGSFRPKTRGQDPCWSRVCDGHTHGEYDYLGRIYCDEKINTQCLGHTTHVFDRSIPCDCDTWPTPSTCDIREPDRSNRRRYTYGGVPTWFVREVYHGPERRRERELRDMAREYNAYGDIEDDDFFNRQGRNSARWDWW